MRAASILHNNAANVLFNMNCPEEALEHYMAAIDIDMRSGVDDATAASMIANVAFVYSSVRWIVPSPFTLTTTNIFVSCPFLLTLNPKC